MLSRLSSAFAAFAFRARRYRNAKRLALTLAASNKKLTAANLDLERKLSDARALAESRAREIAVLTGQEEVLASQIKLLTGVVQRELSRLSAETAMQESRAARAVRHELRDEE